MSELPGIDLDPFDPEIAARVETKQFEQVAAQDEDLSNFIARRQKAYATVFNLDDPNVAEDVQFVLADLAYFARAYQSNFDVNSRVQDLREGRKEVYFRIADHIQLPHQQLYLKYTDALMKIGAKK